MATDIEAITGAAKLQAGVGEPRQFQGTFKVIPFKVTLTDTTQTANKGAQVDVSILGAALGDFVLCASKADLTGGILTAEVASAGVVTFTVWNLEGTDAITPFAGGVQVQGIILKPQANVFDQVA